ncbi:MAG: hypothetical protein GEU78_09705 [Actinobacteria bacterium]|nr:hypothetical protein [Actinomycetota bacterium]
MALPRERLSVWICPTGTPADPDPGTGFPDLWEDITEYVRYREAITISAGRPDEATEVDPSELSLTVDNSDGRFSPRNPMGAYFPDLAQNTPITVAWDVDGLGTLVSLYTGFVTEWPPRWDLTGLDAVVSMRANGVLRRMSQGQPSPKSAIYREIVKASRPDPVAYWTCQDPAGGTRLSSAIAGVSPMVITGTPNLGAFDEWPASEPLPTMNGARYVGPVPNYTQAGEILIRCFYNIPAAGATDQTQLLGFPSSGGAPRWAVFYENNSGGVLRLRVSDDDGVELENSAAAFEVTGTQFSMSLEITRDAPDLDWVLLVVKINPDGSTSASQISGTVANKTLGYVSNVVINYNRLGQDIAFGHIVFSNDTSIFAGTAAALGAWQGERAGDRILRLADEEDIFVDVLGVGSTEIRMGPQRPATILDLIRECEAADGGVLYEAPDAFGLAYRNRGNLYNQNPAMKLSVANGHLAAAPEPIDDDQLMVNDVTVSRETGSSARASDHDHIVKFGRYESTATLNVALNESLADVASWLVHLGTVDEMRWPRIDLELTRHSELVEPWLALRAELASRLTVDHGISQLPGIDVDVLFHGWTERIDGHTWSVELNCGPASPWNTALTATSTGGTAIGPWPYSRADTAGSRTAGAVAEPNPELNLNPTFELDANHWQALQGTIERSTEESYRGVASLKLTPDGVSPAAVAEVPLASAADVVAGLSYTLSAWVYVPDGWDDCRLFVTWHDGTASTDFGPLVDIPPDLWTLVTYTATCPVGKTKARFRFRLENSPSAFDWAYLDEARLTLAQDTVSVQTTDGPVWVTDSAEFPFDILTGGEAMTVTGVSGATSPQTFTVLRAVNGVEKSHAAFTDVRLRYPAIAPL